MLTYFIAPHPPGNQVHFSPSLFFSRIYHIPYSFILNNNLSDKFLIILLLSSAGLLFFFIGSIIKINNKSLPSFPVKEFFVLGYHVFLLLLLASAYLFFTYTDLTRYYFILFIVPLIAFTLFLFKNRTISRYSCLQSLALGSIVFISFIWITFQVFVPFTPIKTSYLPMEFRCIYNTLSKYNVHNGIGGFWIAKPLMAFSKNPKLNIAQFVDKIHEMRWLTTSNWFHDSYDFAIITPKNTHASFKKEDLFLINPISKASAQCGPYEVIIYGTGKLHTH